MVSPPPDPFHILHNPPGAVTSLTVVKFSTTDDCRLVSGSESGIITVWNLKDFRPITNWRAHESVILWLGICNPPDSLLISQGRTESIRFWNCKGELISSIENNHEGFCKCDIKDSVIAIPTGKTGVSSFNITDVTSLKKRNDFVNDKEGTVMTIKLAFGMMVIAYESGYICCWTENSSEILSSSRIDCMPTCIALNSHHGEILVGSSSDKLYVLDECLALKKEVVLTNPGLNAISVRPDGRIFASVGWDRRIRIFGCKSHKKLCVLQCHDDSLNCLAFTSEHSPWLAAGSNDSLISLWNVYNQ